MNADQEPILTLLDLKPSCLSILRNEKFFNEFITPCQSLGCDIPCATDPP